MKANRSYKEDDEAVSPVIGVILMVAITVVLAAVVFVLVSDLGGGGSAPQFPNAESSDASDTPSGGADDGIALEHRGGKALQVADYTWKVGGIAFLPYQSNGGDCDGTGAAATSWSVSETLCLREAAVGDLSAGSALVQVIHKDSETIVYESSITVA